METKGHYGFFHRMDYPQFNICMDIDVSNFIKFTKQNGLSFYYSMVFASATVINQIENFKYRIRDDKVVLHDKIHPSFTDMNKNKEDDLIYVTYIPWISFTHISHTISLNNNDSVPRISWGKYYKQGEKTLLPFSVQVNHSFIDGFHVGKYINN